MITRRRLNYDACNAVNTTKLGIVLDRMVEAGMITREEADLYDRQADALLQPNDFFGELVGAGPVFSNFKGQVQDLVSQFFLLNDASWFSHFTLRTGGHYKGGRHGTAKEDTAMSITQNVSRFLVAAAPMVIGFAVVAAIGAGMETVPHVEQFNPDTVEPHSEDMSWTGGACDDLVDCAFTGRNFCAQRGGVSVMAYDGRDTTDWACEIRCSDETIGHVACLDATLPPIERPGDTTPEAKEETEPDCDPDLRTRGGCWQKTELYFEALKDKVNPAEDQGASMNAAGTFTETDRRVLHLLHLHPGMRATAVGDRLWGRRGRHPQAYARPAGRVLAALEAAGLVYSLSVPREWRLTIPGDAQRRQLNTTDEK